MKGYLICAVFWVYCFCFGVATGRLWEWSPWAWWAAAAVLLLLNVLFLWEVFRRKT